MSGTQTENIPPLNAVCVFLRTAGILNGNLSTSPQSSHASSCSLVAPLAAPHLRHSTVGTLTKARRDARVGVWWRNLDRETVLVAPRENAGETGLLVRGKCAGATELKQWMIRARLL